MTIYGFLKSKEQTFELTNRITIIGRNPKSCHIILKVFFALF